MRYLRVILIIFDLLSLLIIPYTLFSALCYGIGDVSNQTPAVAHKMREMAPFYAHFSWIYLLLVIIALDQSRRSFKRNQLRISIFCLLLPMLALLPLIYLEIQWFNLPVMAESWKDGKPLANDYLCSSQKFVSVKEGREGTIYYGFTEFARFDTNTELFNNFKDLKESLEKKSIDVSKCKNTAGEVLTETSRPNESPQKR